MYYSATRVAKSHSVARLYSVSKRYTVAKQHSVKRAQRLHCCETLQCSLLEHATTLLSTLLDSDETLTCCKKQHLRRLVLRKTTLKTCDNASVATRSNALRRFHAHVDARDRADDLSDLDWTLNARRWSEQTLTVKRPLTRAKQNHAQKKNHCVSSPITITSSPFSVLRTQNSKL
jgi:hypothetical protein